jgi:hypothetical protein
LSIPIIFSNESDQPPKKVARRSVKDLASGSDSVFKMDQNKILCSLKSCGLKYDKAKGQVAFFRVKTRGSKNKIYCPTHKEQYSCEHYEQVQPTSET